MSHGVGADEPHLFHAPQSGTVAQGSGKVGRDHLVALPEFVRKAVAAGYSCEAASALYRKIAQTRADIRARRITPAGGMRRVERMALVVAVVGGAK